MVVFIRCNDIVSDSRAKKYIDFYDRNQIDYRIIAWDRLGNAKHLPNTIYCPYRSKYEQGGFRAIIDRLKWMSFIYRTLFFLHQPLHIHACDLDTAFPAAIYRWCSFRKNRLVFDVFDWISDTIYNQPKPVLWAFAFMERIAVKVADHVIICDEERIRQIPYDISRKYSVLPNIPSFESFDFLKIKEEYRFPNDKITLCYVGSFVPQRCLAELIQGALNGSFNLNIAGYGNRELTQLLENNGHHPHIHYYGKVDYTNGLCIMYNSDIIYAMYAKENPNHIFAAPNKYFECMAVGKPIITTQGIIVADKVLQNHIGYAIDENLASLENLMTQITHQDIQKKSENSAHLWHIYEHCVEHYLQTTYLPFIS